MHLFRACAEAAANSVQQPAVADGRTGINLIKPGSDTLQRHEGIVSLLVGGVQLMQYHQVRLLELQEDLAGKKALDRT